MDLTRESIDFHKIYEDLPLVVPASGIEEAEHFVDRTTMKNPKGILLHIGVNDTSNDVLTQMILLKEQ